MINVPRSRPHLISGLSAWEKALNPCKLKVVVSICMVSSSIKAAAGADVDLILTTGKRRIAVECKASSAPEVGKGFWNGLKGFGIKEAWNIAPVQESYPIEKRVSVANLGDFLAKAEGAARFRGEVARRPVQVEWEFRKAYKCYCTVGLRRVL